MWLHLFVFVVCGISIGIAEDPACRTNETCDCCNSKRNNGSRELSDICNSQQGGWACTYGCLDGYYGGKCWNYCPSYCNRCSLQFGFSDYPNDYQICYLCADGYYNGTGVTNCSTPCPSNCAEKQCNKTTGNCLQGCKSNNWRGDKCNVCADAWYGNNCHIACSNKCKESKCYRNGTCSDGCANENFTGPQCDQCENGKYGDNCDMNCPGKCLNDTCFTTGSTDFFCTDGCIDGYWGWRCKHACPTACIRCDREYGNKTCHQCAAGYYGKTCGINCSVNCLHDQCNKTTGTCLQGCKSNNWRGDKCNVCADAWYGNNCNKPCPTNCIDSKCYSIGNGSDWNCTYGCKDGNWGWKCKNDCPSSCISCHRDYNQHKICYLCADGYYNGTGVTNCSTPCPGNCAKNQCNKTTGNCLQGCTSNWSGDICNVCADTWYGDNCDIECPSKCKNRLCVGNDDCTTGCSNENFTGSQCEQCKTGKYGDNCDKNCPVNCQSDLCAKNGGDCTNGCKGNFVGVRCNECANGMFGDGCNKTCSTGCKSGVCDKNTAICSQDCESGYSGDKCCVNTNGCEVCDTTSTCSKCTTGYFGVLCDQTCPLKCTGACDKVTGNCESCKEGRFYGDKCGALCPANCLDGKCGKDSGRCEEETSQPSSIGPAVGGSIGALVVIALVVLGVWFIFRRRRLQQDENKNITTDGPISDMNNSITDSVEYRNVYENCDPLTDRGNVQPVPVVESKHKPDFHDLAKQVPAEPDGEDEDIDDDYYTFRNVINVVDLPKYVTQKAGEFLSNEFKRLAKGLKQPCTVARKSENIALNRYNGLYPYDHSRVKLSHDKNFFINACYIKGNQQQKAYIASLGPTRVTTENFATFWKMVWYEKSDAIVMLTNLHEPSGMKCEQYWPNLGQTLNLPDFEIKCDSMEDFSEYTLRTFTVTKDNERRTVNQLHYTAWPDKSIPKNVTSLVEFRQRVKSTHTLSQGPVVVHCSAGIGRTGTYIAIDLLTEEGLTEGSVDVFGCIRNMREQRVNMVQTSDQYEYVHRAIVYTLTLDVDYTPTETFNEHVMSLNDSLYGVMFKKLKQPIEFAHPENEIAVTANKRETNKNRPGSDVPGNESRPMLYLNRGFNDSNYINAVYIDGFKRRNRFILAQTPLSSTLEDFVCLIYQDKCSCVVSVEVTDNRKQDVGCYIPQENQSLSFGSFVVTCMKFQNKYNHQYRKLKIQNNGKQADGERIVNHFQYTNWKNTEKVPSSEADFVQFINDAQSSAQEDGLSPLLLHCLTGGEKCGLFCTVSLLLERADIIRQISVVNTVRLLRLGRPNVIPNKEQLKFAHQCVASQMEMHSAYSNFSMK